MVKPPASAQVMILWFTSSSPVLTAQSLEPASDSVSPSLSAPHPLVLCLSKINKNIFKKKTLLRVTEGTRSGIAAHREKQDKWVWCKRKKNIQDNMKQHVLSSTNHYVLRVWR